MVRDMDFVGEDIYTTETLFIAYLSRKGIFVTFDDVRSGSVEGVLTQDYFGLTNGTHIYLSMKDDIIKIVYTTNEDYNKIDEDNCLWWEDEFETGYHPLVRIKSFRLNPLSLTEL